MAQMIKKLEIAAKFLGGELLHMEGFSPQIKWKGEKQYHIRVFNPHEKEGRHWLVEILRKFSPEQRNNYLGKMAKLCPVYDIMGQCFWIATAPSDICFDCIMEVLNND